jgi:predicted dehydrogenase
MLSSLVVGYGSIGARHAEVLAEIGCSVALVSRRAVAGLPAFKDLAEALAVRKPQYIVVANETDLHHATLSQLADLGYPGTVLIEKPLFSNNVAIPTHAFRETYVAYNLRFHPIIARLKELLQQERIISTHAYVGQYLPDWRPQADYRKTYSASSERGGGVLRDLSHELDYLTWMLGGWSSVAAVGGHFSSLEITSDDVFSLLMTTPRCPAVSVHLNYLDRVAKRVISINTDRFTVQANLVKGTLTLNGETESFQTERNATYRAMHAAAIKGKSDVVCSLDEGVETLLLIEAAVKAAETRKWVKK